MGKRFLKVWSLFPNFFTYILICLQFVGCVKMKIPFFEIAARAQVPLIFFFKKHRNILTFTIF